MTKVDLLHNLRVKFNELSLREYVIVEEAFEELQEDLKHKKIAIQNRKARIKELEKENAELKEELKDANEKVVHLACNQNKHLKYKLTEAKEIIDNFLDFESSCQERGIYISDEIREKANKFLELVYEI